MRRGSLNCVFGLATLYFVDSSVENHLESPLAGLEVGMRAGTELPSNQSRPVKEQGAVLHHITVIFMTRSQCWINR